MVCVWPLSFAIVVAKLFVRIESEQCALFNGGKKTHTTPQSCIVCATQPIATTSRPAERLLSICKQTIICPNHERGTARSLLTRRDPRTDSDTVGRDSVCSEGACLVEVQRGLFALHCVRVSIGQAPRTGGQAEWGLRSHRIIERW